MYKKIVISNLYIAIHHMSHKLNMEGIAPNYDEMLVTEFLS